MSIASLHSVGVDEKMETAGELVDEEHPKGYRESSFRDFLNFPQAKNVIKEGRNEELHLDPSDQEELMASVFGTVFKIVLFSHLQFILGQSSRIWVVRSTCQCRTTKLQHVAS
ncbi:hypothetical protein SLA2020_353550 [Shorea laevis]